MVTSQGERRLLGDKRPVLVIALVISTAVATLVSTSGGPVRPFNFCLTCNFRWLADWLANVAMFVPLGLAMNWKRRHFIRTTLRVAAFSISIELLQTTIPGRDPTLSDVIANSIGGAFGALLGRSGGMWLTPPQRLADRLLALAIVMVAITVAETEWLLAPTTNLPVGSQALNAVSALVRGSATMAFNTVSTPSSAQQPVLVVAPARQLPLLYIGRIWNDAIFQYRSRGRELRLDQPAYLVRDFFDSTANADTIRITVGREGAGWCLSRTNKRSCGIGPTVGLGWAILRYPYSLKHRWHRGLRDVWAALLFLLVGFWSRRRTLPIAVLAAALILGPYARFTPLLPTPMDEWIGAFAGLTAGFAARTLVFRSRMAKSVGSPPVAL